jgi:apolipoprotein N-acyltransferase
MNAPRMKMRSTWKKIAAAVTGGVLMAGVFPPFGMTLLVWVALVPLLAALWSVEGKRAGWKGFGIGWLAGMASLLLQCNWVASVSWVGAVLLPMYLAIYWGLFGAFAATLGNLRSRTGSLRIAFSLAAVWAGLELLRGWVITGFGWNGLAMAFCETPLMAQGADLLGATGLSMLPVFFQAVLLQAGKRICDGNRRLPLDLVAALAVVGLMAGYGFLRISNERDKESVRLKALLVQLNIPQEAALQLWTAEQVHMGYEDETIKALEQIKAEDSSHWPDWVMWPECALTGRILRTYDGTWAMWRENLETIAQVRKAGPFQLIYGVNELEAEMAGADQLVMKPKGRAWNSIAVMSPDDQLQTYRKRHLVIFGETIPFVDSIPWLKKIYEQQSGVEYGGSFTAGVSLDPLPVPTAKGDVIGAIPTVCFEDSVPRLVRKFVRNGPQVIVNTTNDGWFKQSAAAAQHFANARFRAIELRRPMLRCANTGVSAAIDTTGSTAHPDTGKPQILRDENGSHFTRGSLLTELKVPLHPSTTLYAIIGDYGLMLIALTGLLLPWASRRKMVA